MANTQHTTAPTAARALSTRPHVMRCPATIAVGAAFWQHLTGLHDGIGATDSTIHPLIGK